MPSPNPVITSPATSIPLGSPAEWMDGVAQPLGRLQFRLQFTLAQRRSPASKGGPDQHRLTTLDTSE